MMIFELFCFIICFLLFVRYDQVKNPADVDPTTPYLSLRGDKRATVEKRVHSAAWHLERDYRLSIGDSEFVAKEAAGIYAFRQVGRWREKVTL